VSNGRRALIVGVLIIAMVVVGIIGYAVVGFAYAASRVASADRTLNVVLSHQDSLNTTFTDINTEFSGLGSSSAYNPQQAKSVADLFVVDATKASTTVSQDDASLSAASRSLREQGWLTLISRKSLDSEVARIAHARKALTDARTVAGDYVLDGQFLQAFLDATADLDSLATQTASSDMTGAGSTLSAMKTHVDKAMQLSTAPGLPADIHALIADFETLVADFDRLVAAAQANDDVGFNAASASIQADANKISGYNFDKISADIEAFYKPLVEDFNSEMTAATT
jgi:hypothetical protein